MKFNWRAAGLKQGPKGDGSPPAGLKVRATLLAIALTVLPMPSLTPCGVGLASAATLPAGTTSVPMDVQDLVEATLSTHMVLPQTALWNFAFMAPYATGGDVICGSVNYQSAMRKYLGPQRFYVIIKHGVVSIALLQDPPFVDTTGAEAERFRVLCDRK